MSLVPRSGLSISEFVFNCGQASSVLGYVQNWPAIIHDIILGGFLPGGAKCISIHSTVCAV